ncbi:MAG: sensor histidine kinase [Polyangiaceae bacterium]|nr:sensor histidine kinase [Polyangiaceae bacterium]
MSTPAPADPPPGVAAERDLAGALHEVSNALTVVLGWLQAAEEAGAPGPAAEALEVARAHARRGHRVARLALGAAIAEEDLERDARGLACEAIVAVQPEATRRGVVLEPVRVAEDASLGGATDALHVLLNLLLNAVSFTPAGRRVELAVGRTSEHVVFTVRDEGPGVAPERVATLFGGGGSTREGGAGVGLRHSRALAEAHGATLETAASAAGAAFELRWPVAAVRSSARHRPERASLAGRRVLVVEDDAAIRDLLELALGAQGAEVVLAPTGRALEQAIARGERFDAAVVDLSPLAEAPGALAALRAQGVPLVVASGSSVGAALDEEADAWLRKPFETAEVAEALEELLARRARDRA